MNYFLSYSACDAQLASFFDSRITSCDLTLDNDKIQFTLKKTCGTQLELSCFFAEIVRISYSTLL